MLLSASAGALANIACQVQQKGALVAAGAIEACVAVLQSGPDDAKCNGSLTLANLSNHEHKGIGECIGGSRCNRGLHCSAAIWTL